MSSEGLGLHMGRRGTERPLGAWLRCPVLNPSLLRDRHWESISCKTSQSLLSGFFFTQLEDADFAPLVLFPQQGLDSSAVDSHASPAVLLELFVAVIFPAGLHRGSVTIPFGHLLANGVFLFGKLLANGLFPVPHFLVTSWVKEISPLYTKLLLNQPNLYSSI